MDLFWLITLPKMIGVPSSIVWLDCVRHIEQYTHKSTPVHYLVWTSEVLHIMRLSAILQDDEELNPITCLWNLMNRSKWDNVDYTVKHTYETVVGDECHLQKWRPTCAGNLHFCFFCTFWAWRMYFYILVWRQSMCWLLQSAWWVTKFHIQFS